MSHAPAVTQGGESEALISNHPGTDTAVVFVHGFKGHYRKTWQDFQSLIDKQAAKFPSWDTSDIFFFAYDAENQHPGTSAQQLFEFINSVFPTPPPEFFGEGVETDWLLEDDNTPEQERTNEEWSFGESRRMLTESSASLDTRSAQRFSDATLPIKLVI